MTDPQIQGPDGSAFHIVPTAPIEFGVDMHTLKPDFPMQLPNLSALFRMEIDSIFLMSFACGRHLVNECSKRLP